MIDGDLYPTYILNFLWGPLKYAAVVKSVHIQRNRIFAAEKYLIDSHVLTAMGKPYYMRQVLFESNQRRVRPHDPNMMFVICNYVAMVLQLILLS